MPKGQEDILQANAEASVQDFVGFDNNTHKSHLSTSIANLIDILEAKYELNSEDKSKAMGEFKEKALGVFPLERKEKLEDAFEYIAEVINEPTDELDYATIKGEKKLYPLSEVFPLVCKAIMDQEVYGDPPKGSTKDDELKARVLTLGNTLIDLLPTEVRICNHGIRNDLVMTLNMVYPGVNIIEDLDSYILTLVKEYFEKDLQKLKDEGPAKHYKLLVVWMDAFSSEEDKKLLEDYISTRRDKCRSYIVNACAGHGLTEDLEGKILIPEVAKKVDDAISYLADLTVPVGSDPLLISMKKIFDWRFCGIDNQKLNALKIKRKGILEEIQKFLHEHQGALSGLQDYKDWLAIFVRVDDAFLKYMKVMDSVDKAILNVKSDGNQVYADILQQVLEALDVLYDGYTLESRLDSQLTTSMENKLSELNEILKQAPPVFRITDWDTLASELKEMPKSDRSGFVITTFRDLPDCLRGVITNGGSFWGLYDLMCDENDDEKRLKLEFVNIFLDQAPPGYLQKIFHNGDFLLDFLSILPEVDRSIFIHDSMQPGPEYMHSVFKDEDLLWKVLELLPYGDEQKDFIELLLNQAQPDYLQAFIRYGGTLAMILDLFSLEERWRFITNSLQATPEYFQGIIQGQDSIDELYIAANMVHHILELFPADDGSRFRGQYLGFLTNYFQGAIENVDQLTSLLERYQIKDRFEVIQSIFKPTPGYLRALIINKAVLEDILDYLPKDKRIDFILDILQVTPEYLRGIIEHGRNLEYLLLSLPKDDQPKLIKIWLTGISKDSKDYFQSRIHSADFLKKILHTIPEEERWGFVINSLQATPKFLRRTVYLEQDLNILEVFPIKQRTEFINLLLKNAEPKYIKGLIESMDGLEMVLGCLSQHKEAEAQGVVGAYDQGKSRGIPAFDQLSFLEFWLEGAESDYLQEVLNDDTRIKALLDIIPQDYPGELRSKLASFCSDSETQLNTI